MGWVRGGREDVRGGGGEAWELGVGSERVVHPDRGKARSG